MKRARNVEQSSPHNSRRFGADITNDGALDRGRTCGTGNVSGEAPTSLTPKTRRLESAPGRPEGITPRGERSCGRDVCGIVFRAEGEPEKRLCPACHRPSQDWAHFPPDYVPRATQRVEDLNKRGMALPSAVLEGYSPSTDCLCTKGDCNASCVRNGRRSNKLGRTVCSVCRRSCHSGLRKLPSDLVAQAFSFFTTEKGAWRKNRLAKAA